MIAQWVSTRWACAALAAIALATPARAELVLSQLVVDLADPSRQRVDVEIWNNEPERSYVAVEPSEILNPGTASEERLSEPDPEKRGLLVSPARMILEPGQRRIVRFTAMATRGTKERVYRVTVKPVAGELSAVNSGLKLLVGYDVLVLLRPVDPKPALAASRSGHQLNFTNRGNASLELVNGRQCERGEKVCRELPSKRLYPGASWSQTLSSDSPLSYDVIVNGRSSRQTF